MMVAAAADIRATFFASVRRILVISVDGQGGQDTSVARRKSVGASSRFLGW